MTVETQITTNAQAEINDELRSYAERSPVSIVRPSMEEAIAAIEPHFPELVTEHGNAQDLLDAVGLPVITDISRNYKPKRISWSIVDCREDAEATLKKYNQPRFKAIRDQLGINYHWIFLVPSRSLLVCSDEKLMDGIGDFREDGMPNCWIFDRFH